MEKPIQKVKGIFTQIKDIIGLVISEIRQYDQTLIPISIIQTSELGSKPSHELDPSFMYAQVMKDIL